MKQMITTLPMKRHGMGNNAPRLMTLRDDCDASDEHYTGSTRAARQRSGEGREANAAVDKKVATQRTSIENFIL